jgi:hypothetical protein
MLNVNMPMYIWQGAIGFQLLNESVGAESQTAFSASYNYILEAGGLGLFSFWITGRYLSEIIGW